MVLNAEMVKASLDEDGSPTGQYVLGRYKIPEMLTTTATANPNANVRGGKKRAGNVTVDTPEQIEQKKKLDGLALVFLGSSFRVDHWITLEIPRATLWALWALC